MAPQWKYHHTNDGDDVVHDCTHYSAIGIHIFYFNYTNYFSKLNSQTSISNQICKSSCCYFLIRNSNPNLNPNPNLHLNLTSQTGSGPALQNLALSVSKYTYGNRGYDGHEAAVARVREHMKSDEFPSHPKDISAVSNSNPAIEIVEDKENDEYWDKELEPHKLPLPSSKVDRKSAGMLFDNDIE